MDYRQRSNQQVQEGACPRDNYGLGRRAAMGLGNIFEIIGLVLALNREARRLD